jgi:hypothetical protein
MNIKTTIDRHMLTQKLNDVCPENLADYPQQSTGLIIKEKSVLGKLN